MASKKFHSYVNYCIIALVPIVICITLLWGVKETFEVFGVVIPTPDYIQYYERDWAAVLNLQNPYPDCLYPPGFLIFSGFYYFHPLLPKVFFCLIWIITGLYLNKMCKEHDVSRKSTLYYVFALILFHPLYWGITVISGHYDVTVGLCVLLAVYGIDHSNQLRSGIYSAFAFLLKFIGLILIFPLVFLKKKINWRIGVIFIAICGGIYLIGYFLWGVAVFEPILIHIYREPEGGSIFTFISDFLGIDSSLLIAMVLIAGMFVIAIFLYFQNTDICSFSLILILLFLLILPVVWLHYAAWFLPLAAYWSITHNGKLQGTIFYYHIGGLIAALVSWFIATWLGAIIFFGSTAAFVFLIYLFRNKGEINKE